MSKFNPGARIVSPALFSLNRKPAMSEAAAPAPAEPVTKPGTKPSPVKPSEKPASDPNPFKSPKPAETPEPKGKSRKLCMDSNQRPIGLKPRPATVKAKHRF